MVPRFSNPLNVAGNIARDKLHGIPDVPATPNILFHDPDHRLRASLRNFHGNIVAPRSIMQTNCYETFIQNNLVISSITRKLSLEERGRGSIVATIPPSFSSVLTRAIIEYSSSIEPRSKKMREEN